MAHKGISESDLEETALSWFSELDFEVKHGPEIAPGELFQERSRYSDVVLAGRLKEAIARTNPDIPEGDWGQCFLLRLKLRRTSQFSIYDI